jgi:hypothetical protein
METIPSRGEPSQKPEGPSKGSIGLGIAIAVLCEFCYFVLAVLVSALRADFYVVFLMSWGIIPLMILIPLFLMQLKSGHSRTAKGIVIIGSIAFLLNATCDAAVRIPLFWG